jgi:signal transduction histidine kinase
MTSQLTTMQALLSAWVRKPLSPLLLLMLAGAVFVASETSYQQTRSSLNASIALSESRTNSSRLLQLLTDMEAAEFGFLTTGQQKYLDRYARGKAQLPALAQTVTGFFSEQGAEGQLASKKIDAYLRKRMSHIDQLLLAANGADPGTAAALIQNEHRHIETERLSLTIKEQLDRAALLQQGSRASIYDALLLDRVAVGSLTLVSVISILLFVHQLKGQERGRGLERERLETQVQQRTKRITELAAHFQSVREEERSRIARELHDELGALLTVSKLEIARARNKAGQTNENLATLDRVTEAIDRGIALKRRIMEDLSPSSLTHLGLTIAIENLCKDMSVTLGIPVQLSSSELDLSRPAELAVYRFVQEALTNIGKHASASRVTVLLHSDQSNGPVVIEVRDDGIGFDAIAPEDGRHGLSGMQFRAESLGGSLQIYSDPGVGTRVRMEFPRSVATAAG